MGILLSLQTKATEQTETQAKHGPSSIYELKSRKLKKKFRQCVERSIIVCTDRAVCVCLRETLTHWCVLIDEQVRLEEVILETRWLIRGWRTERQIHGS